jgi:hypothetical protein
MLSLLSDFPSERVNGEFAAQYQNWQAPAPSWMRQVSDLFYISSLN